jgi:hypothetical protein
MVFRTDLTDATRMAGGARTRGMRRRHVRFDFYIVNWSLVFRTHLTEATRMAGGTRTRGMRTTCKVWYLL